MEDKKLSRTAYKNLYAKENYKRVPLNLKKSDYEKLEQAAEQAGEKVNTFIKKAIEDRLKALMIDSE